MRWRRNAERGGNWRLLILALTSVYIITDNVKALYKEYSSLPGVKIARQLCPQEYGVMEFDVIDLNGNRLVFAQPMPAK